MDGSDIMNSNINLVQDLLFIHKMILKKINYNLFFCGQQIIHFERRVTHICLTPNYPQNWLP